MRVIRLLRYPTFWLNGRITAHTASQFGSWLEGMKPQPRLTLVLNSSGGNIGSALRINYIIRALSSVTDVHVLVTKECLSAALIVLCAVDQSRRTALPGTQFYTHSVTLERSDGMRFPCQTFLSQEEIEAESLKTGIDLSGAYYFQRKLIRLYTEATGLPLVTVGGLLSPEGRWFSAKKAREIRFIAHIARCGGVVILCARAYLYWRRTFSRRA